MTHIAYTEALEDLRREGYSRADIDAAFTSLSEAGMQTSDADGLLGEDALTTEELDIVRRQLEAGNESERRAELDFERQS